MTIIRCEYDGVIYDLDVLDQTPIRVDISAIENSEIGDVFGASSQTFTLPGSKKNNRFFKHAYKVGVTNVPGLGESVRASVITNSNTLLEGSLFLDEVIRTPFDGVNYQVVITNDVVSFNESIKTVAVKDLDWDSYDHTLSLENITGSWTDNLFSGDVLYPLVDYGQDGVEGTGSVPLVEINSSGLVGYMNNSGTPLQVQQFSPSIRVSTILDKIFEQGGFSYSSSLQSTFDNLYILPKQTETLSVKGSGFSDYGFIAGGASAQIVPPGSSNVTVEFPTETYDPTNSFNTSTSTFTIPRAGSYVITGFINYAFSTAYVVGDVTIRMYRNSSIIAESTQTFGGTTTSLQQVNLSTPSTEGEYLYFNSGDDIKIEITYTASAPYNPNITLLSYSIFRTTVTPINYATGTVQLGQQFDPQTKCIDILKGLIEKFNLVIEPVYTQNRLLKIESYKDWTSSGTRKDWTQKVERAKRIGLKSPLSSQPKSLIFEDNKDNDKLSKQVIDNAEGFQWGTEIIDAVSDVPQGEKKVGSYFSPVILEKINGGGTYNVIPKLYKTDNSQFQKKTFKHKPRLGYKITGSLNTTCYIGDDADEFTEYATLSNYESIPIVSGSTNNLHYNDSFYTPTFQSVTGTKTAYENYWSYYISELYEDDNRILNLDLEFLPEEIKDIKLNDKIFVEDTVYRINRISGYNLVNPDIVNVELIKIKDKLSFPGCDFDFTVLEGPFSASGGTEIEFTSGGYDYISHTFITDGTFTVTQGSTNQAQVLVVGGGGAGARSIAPGDNSLTRWYGGGGGAGQLIYSSSVSLNTGSYDITIGDGGATIVSASGEDGTETIITGSTIDITAYGGGGGGWKNLDGNDGGSGGGAGPSSTSTSPGVAIYGDFGSTGGQKSLTHPTSYPSTNYYQGGGGGGAGGAASNRTGGVGLGFTMEDGNTNYYAFGGTVKSELSVPYPANYEANARGNGGNFGNDGTNGMVIITYRVT